MEGVAKSLAFSLLRFSFEKSESPVKNLSMVLKKSIDRFFYAGHVFGQKVAARKQK